MPLKGRQFSSAFPIPSTRALMPLGDVKVTVNTKSVGIVEILGRKYLTA